MAFLRLGGCSVGCANCDTNYSTVEALSAADIVSRLGQIRKSRDAWVWITGGEPADYDLRGLLRCLKAANFSTAVATSGHKRFVPPVDWLSVSPHDPSKWQQRYGNELKIVDGLSVPLDSWDDANLAESDFMYRYVQPLSHDGREDPASLQRCLRWLESRPDWALSRQDHIYWNLP